MRRDDHGYVVLSPLRFDFESDELRLPVRLGLLNAEGDQDLIVYILHPSSRFEVANYDNVFIPSNLEVDDAVRKRFGAFYAALFDETLRRAGRAVVTEYAWQTTSCDPCPVPPLQPSDLYTLGGDVLEGLAPPGMKTLPSGPQTPPRGAKVMARRGPFFGGFSSWVLTRLHTRYRRETLTEDLVFVRAQPVTGGRAGPGGTGVEKPGGVQMSSTNNFQGRYIIRHYWEGAAKCDNPVWNRWGGPPNGGDEKVTPAGDLASAPRGKVSLKTAVRSNLPQFDIPGVAPPRRGK